MPEAPAANPFAFLQDLLLGGTSGVIAKTACAPLERVKILLQVQSASAPTPLRVFTMRDSSPYDVYSHLFHPLSPSPRAGANSSGTKYKGFLDAMVRVPKEQGVAALWRGNTANCLRYFPTQAMNFAFKERYQKMFVRPKEEVGFAQWFAGYLLAGGAAGATSLTVSYPLEFTYTRLAADTGAHGAPAAAVAGGAAPAGRQYTGIVDCLVKTVKSDGIRGIYRGYGPSVAGIIVYRAGYFGLFDFSKAYVMPQIGLGSDSKHSKTKQIAAKFSLALIVDIFSAMTAYPLDTIRRSMMMMSGRSDKLYTTSFGCASYIHKNGGVAAFYKGAMTNNVRAIGSALVLVLYDELRALLLPGAVSASKH